MTYKRLHHIGIVMPSMEAVHGYMEQYGLSVAAEGHTPYQAACVFSQPRGAESPIEFLVPQGGPLAAFNDGKGGLHHLCYEVDDIEAASRELRAAGCALLEAQTITAEQGLKINFVRPGSSFGLLVELMELPK